jgi:glycine oxidase
VAASKTILILGAGALGSMTAYLAARAGHRVTVVDDAPLGANASGVAAGMLAPAFESLLDAPTAGRFPLLREARDLWPPIAAGLGLSLDRSGAMAMGRRDEADAWADGLRALGADAAVVAAPGGRWGALTPDDWRLDPMPALVALRRAAGELGARFQADWPASFDGDGAVIATGAAQGLVALAPELSLLTPVKGHILRAAGTFRPGPVLRAAGVYLCRSGHEALLGATMEMGRADAAVDPAVAARLLAEGRALTAELGDLDWRPAAGVRAATPDGLPMVGRSGSGGFILAVGARRNGWLLAPMIASAVLDALEGRQSVQSALFDPARFSSGGSGSG